MKLVGGDLEPIQDISIQPKNHPASADRQYETSQSSHSYLLSLHTAASSTLSNFGDIEDLG
jgi:hypothetical protein